MPEHENYAKADFEYFFNLSIDLLCIINENGKFLKINPIWRRFLGYTEDELMGNNVLDYVHPDDRASTSDAYKTLMAGNEILNFENRVICKDGTYKWIDWNSQPVNGVIYSTGRNITERKELENDLSSALIYNSKIFFAAPFAISSYNSKGECKSCNIAYSKIAGKTVPEMLTIKLHDLEWCKETGLAGLASKSLLTGTDSEIEFNINSENGSDLWYRCFITYFKSNNESHILITIMDITEKRLKYLRISESEHLFRDMLSNIKLIAIILDIDFNIKFVNDYCQQLFGYTAENIVNKNLFDVFAHNPEAAQNLRRDLLSDNLPRNFEYEIQARNGDKLFIKWANTILKDEDKNITGIAFIGEDVTGFKIYENILNFRFKMSEMEFDTNLDSMTKYTLEQAEILTGSKIGFFHFFDDTLKNIIIQTWSPNTLTGGCNTLPGDMNYNLEDAGVWADCIRLKRPIIHNDYNSLPNKKGLPAGHIDIHRELLYPILKDDKVVAVLGVGNKDSEYTQKDIDIISALSDTLWSILYKKKMTDALRESEQKLMALNKTKDKFFSIIAHDLKSPFQGLLGSLQILTSEFDYLSNEEKKEFITNIERLSQYTYKLLENLLQWSRLQTGHMDFNVQIFNVKNTFDDSIEMFKNISFNKNISISSSIPKEFFVKADLNMANTIFRNILSNAIKFTPKGGVIKIAAKESGDLIELSIEDSGIGMSEEEVEGLFQIEKQHNKKGTNGESGTGLGLIVCKEMIEKNGGTLNVNSVLNQGSTFSFSLQKV